MVLEKASRIAHWQILSRLGRTYMPSVFGLAQYLITISREDQEAPLDQGRKETSKKADSFS